MGKKNKNDKNIEYLEEQATLVGRRERELIDKDTGEIMKVEQIVKLRYGTKNFWKCYMKEFLTVLKKLEGKQLKVFIYIVENTKPSTNEFVGTYDKMAKATKCCRQTVAATIKKLKEQNFMQKKHNGIWIINPNILVKGNDRKREILLSEYKIAEALEKEKKNKSAK